MSTLNKFPLTLSLVKDGEGGLRPGYLSQPQGWAQGKEGVPVFLGSRARAGGQAAQHWAPATLTDQVSLAKSPNSPEPRFLSCKMGKAWGIYRPFLL